MFLSIDEKAGFNPTEQQEINNAFSAIEDRIASTKVEGVEETLETQPIEITEASENWSIKIGDHLVSLLFKVPVHEAEEKTMSYNEFKETYCEEADSAGLCYVKSEYVLSRNDKQIRAADATAARFYYMDDTAESVGVNPTFKIENYTVGKVKYPPLSKLSVKLANTENDLSKIYYGVVRTDGTIEIMSSHDKELVMQLIYVIT